MIETIEIELPITVTIEFEAFKAEPRTRHYPGAPAYCEILSIKFPDGDAVIVEYENEIHEECWDHLNECAAENAMAEAEYRKDALENR